jgi:cysteinyl-tRNA synthetase
MIRLHNTASGTLETFTPQNPALVTLYTCGPTVYNEPLIGNWVAYIRWDLLVRTLLASDLTVKRVMNITDVGHLVSDADEGEDKMQTGAKREGITAWEVAERYTNRFLEGMTALNLLPPEILSKATEHIEEQIDLIKRLEAGGHTYVIDDGVYFDTTTFPRYADFAHLDLEAMKAGARVEFNPQKHNPSDFALWKFSPADEQRDMEWESPWSPPNDPEGKRKGFPGWHIECSAMAIKYLGDTLDIHTGGIDHIPVHHTNEIAQSEAATGKQFANYWLHANFLLVGGTKISKSLGNGYTLGDLSEKGFSALDFRMFVLQSHYRSESNFTWDNLAAAATRLKHWRAVACLRHQMHDTLVDEDDKDNDINGRLLAAKHAALEALNSDLNSPLALTHFEQALDGVEQTQLEHVRQTVFVDLLSYVDDTLGIKLLDTTPDIDDDMKQLLLERQRARDEKQWQRSDELRDQLATSGIGLNDTGHGVRWYYL